VASVGTRDGLRDRDSARLATLGTSALKGASTMLLSARCPTSRPTVRLRKTRSNPHQSESADESGERREVEPVGEFELKGIRRPLAAYNVQSVVS
jgi:hypothetical protein